MKKFDLHIHTLPTISDSSFVFDINKLKEYVKRLNLDCIAITNHNTFDFDQFKIITENLSISVLPGIEINLEGGHLLLISSNKELIDFQDKCKKVNEQIHTANDQISVSQLKSIFFDLSRYLLIPHYDKNPSLTDHTLNELRDYIVAGEVNSVKKFQYCLKNSESLTPVLFSDIRIKDDLDTNNLPTRQTYIDVGDIKLDAIKFCLSDKSKVSLSKSEGHNLFQVLPNGLEISTGLTVVLGNRSSGKTHTLDEIAANTPHTKYIKQFSLLETDEEKDKKNFETLISTKQSSYSETYLKEFKQVVDEVKDIDIIQDLYDFDTYLSSLLKNASEVEKADIFSKSTLFNENVYEEQNLDNLQTLINSVTNLIDNIEYREIINKYVTLENLKLLALELINKYNIEQAINLKMRWLNDLINNIKKSLQLRTAATVITSMDFYKMLLNRRKMGTFCGIVREIQKDAKIDEKDLYSFKIEAFRKKFTSSSELKSLSGRKTGFTNAYNKYSNPFEFLQELKKIESLADTEYYKYFVKIDYRILNKLNCPVSGGERSEFNLLNAINDAMQHDMLLLDEPESSFDNLFLKNSVNEIIKNISKIIPVVIVTHNNTVGASIKPDYIVYTNKKISGTQIDYQIFTGYPTDKYLTSLEGEKISNFEILLNSLEAGQTTYKERGESYEVLKD